MTPKQERFCEEYLIDLNATQAAIRAGYSKKTAKEQASRLLTNVNVQEKLQEGRAKLTKASEITAEMMLQRCGEIAFSNIGTFFDVTPDGYAMVNLAKCTPYELSLIESIECTEVVESGAAKQEGDSMAIKTKVKLKDWKAAMAFLSKWKGMDVSKLDVTSGGEKLPAQIVVQADPEFFGKAVEDDSEST